LATSASRIVVADRTGDLTLKQIKTLAQLMKDIENG